MDNDRVLRIPRKPEERANGFAAWLEATTARLVAPALRSLQTDFTRKVEAELRDGPALDRFGPRRVAGLLWTEMESRLRQTANDYLLRRALSGIVLDFTARRLGDNWLVGIPERRGDGWAVPLYDRANLLQPVAEVETDADGNILSDDATLRTRLKVEW
jgi:hypothetical protein